MSDTDDAATTDDESVATDGHSAATDGDSVATDGHSVATDGGDERAFEAVRYADGSLSYPAHPIGPDGSEAVGTVDLRGYTATVVTWTTSTTTPPGVRAPNHLAIVEFDVDGQPVRALGQLTEDGVDIGDEVRPVYCEELRDPEIGIREPASQDWDGYRFEPVD